LMFEISKDKHSASEYFSEQKGRLNTSRKMWAKGGLSVNEKPVRNSK